MERLPNECLLNIIVNLSVRDRASVMAVSKQMLRMALLSLKRDFRGKKAVVEYGIKCGFFLDPIGATLITLRNEETVKRFCAWMTKYCVDSIEVHRHKPRRRKWTRTGKLIVRKFQTSSQAKILIDITNF